MTPKLPLCVGSYDDGGQVSDATGHDLFTFGCNDDTREMDEHTKSIAAWTLYRLNNFDKIVEMLRLVEKNLNRSMSKSIQRLQAKSIDEYLEELNHG